MPVTALPQRLRAAWLVLRGGVPSIPESAVGDTDAADDTRLAAEALAAGARLDAEEARKQVDSLRRELEADRASRTAAVEAAVSARLEPVLAEAATLMGQLALQAHLIETGTPVQARDVIAVAGRLGGLFERQGLAPLGAIGDRVAYDPARHRVLGTETLVPGSNAVVRVPGYTMGGRLVHKAMVEPAPGP